PVSGLATIAAGGSRPTGQPGTSSQNSVPCVPYTHQLPASRTTNQPNAERAHRYGSPIQNASTVTTLPGGITSTRGAVVLWSLRSLMPKLPVLMTHTLSGAGVSVNVGGGSPVS